MATDEITAQLLRENEALRQQIAGASGSVEFDRDKVAYEIARSFYGYYNGGSAGASLAMAYFAYNWEHLPGLNSTVERAREILDRMIPQNPTSATSGQHNR